MQSRDIWKARFALVGIVLALGGCGGGGGDDTATAPSPSPTPSPSPSPSPAAASTCGQPDFVNVAMARINQWRAAGANCGAQGVFAPTTALAWNNLLTQAADAHSQDMVTNNFFAHEGSNGSSPGDRIAAAGYSASAWGENIAAGQTTINQVVDAWIDSDGHCANLMNPNLTEVGLACVSGSAATTYPTYWTMELARPR